MTACMTHAKLSACGLSFYSVSAGFCFTNGIPAGLKERNLINGSRLSTFH